MTHTYLYTRKYNSIINLCPGKLIESLEKQLSDKGAEINGYMEKHNIQLKDQQVQCTARFVRAFTFICIIAGRS